VSNSITRRRPTQVPPKNRQAQFTAVLADGINLGLAACCSKRTCRINDQHAPFYTQMDHSPDNDTSR
jgi:hypothetical protein